MENSNEKTKTADVKKEFLAWYKTYEGLIHFGFWSYLILIILFGIMIIRFNYELAKYPFLACALPKSFFYFFGRSFLKNILIHEKIKYLAIAIIIILQFIIFIIIFRWNFNIYISDKLDFLQKKYPSIYSTNDVFVNYVSELDDLMTLSTNMQILNQSLLTKKGCCHLKEQCILLKKMLKECIKYDNDGNKIFDYCDYKSNNDKYSLIDIYKKHIPSLNLDKYNINISRCCLNR